MSAVIKEIHLIGGIQVNVFKARTEPPSHSVAILFLLHGRKGSVKDVDSIATTIIDKNASDKQHRKLWVVTLVKHILSPHLEFMSKGINFPCYLATFRIIVTMVRDLSNQELIVHGPIESATAFMRMFYSSIQFPKKRNYRF